MLLVLARGIVMLAGLYLLTLGVTAAIQPTRARRFLEAHASTARVHFLELALRAVAGAAFVVAAPTMRGSELVRIGGWILVITTLALALTPWQLHRRFAAWSVPMATRSMGLVAMGAVAGGVVLVAALLLGPPNGLASAGLLHAFP